MCLPRLVSAEASAEFSARPDATPSGSKAELILVVGQAVHYATLAARIRAIL